MLRDASVGEMARWDELVARNPDGGHILQSKAWGEFKARHGWANHYRVLEMDEHNVMVLVLAKTVAGVGEIRYVPYGPGVVSLAGYRAAVDAFREAHENNARLFMIKLGSELPVEAASPEKLEEMGLVKAPDIQVGRATIIVDLTPDEETLINSFKQKTRYNIRLAARKGVTVEAVEATAENLETMYGLYSAMQGRVGFFLRPKAYYLDYWKAQSEAGQGKIFLAREGGDVLAGAFVTYLGRRGWYKDGGSFRTKSNLMAPYLLQWEIMRWLKARGVESYDMVAVPPRDQLTEDHPYYGLYQFKSGFNENITEYVGVYDLPLKPGKYRLWSTIGERATGFVSKRLRGDLFY